MFGVSGAIVSYVMGNNSDYIEIALILPAVMNLGLGILSLINIESLKSLAKRHKEICYAVRMKKPYKLDPVVQLARCCYIMYFFMSFGLFALMFLLHNDCIDLTCATLDWLRRLA